MYVNGLYTATTTVIANSDITTRGEAFETVLTTIIIIHAYNDCLQGEIYWRHNLPDERRRCGMRGQAPRIFEV